MLGNNCNLHCDFCFWEKEEAPVTKQISRRVIDEIRKAGIRKMTISGGEPICSPYFLETLEYAKNKDLKVVLHTNGLLIGKKLAREIATLVERVSLSLDGSDEKMAFRMRKQPFTHHTLMLIGLFHSLRVPVNVKTLVTKVNKSDIEKIGEILADKPILYWSLLEFNPIGRGLKNKDKYFLTSREFRELSKRVTRLFPNISIRIREFRTRPEKYCLVSASGKVFTYAAGKGDILIGDAAIEELAPIIDRISRLNLVKQG